MTDAIAHITWPDHRPDNVEVSLHPHGPLRDTAEAVLRTVARHGHIVMTGPVTWNLGSGEEVRLEYVVLVELDSGTSMLWHHHFTHPHQPWPVSGQRVVRQEAQTR